MTGAPNPLPFPDTTRSTDAASADVTPADAAAPPDAALPDAAAAPDATAPPDAAPLRDVPTPAPGACTLTVESARSGLVATCVLCPDAGDVCALVAECVCRVAATAEPDTPEALEACVESLLMPRGAINLSDYCRQPELTLADLMRDTAWLMSTTSEVLVSMSPGCADVPLRAPESTDP